MRVALFASGPVGVGVADILADSNADLRILVEDAGDRDCAVASRMKVVPPQMRVIRWAADETSLASQLVEAGVELGVLAWWPRILGPTLLRSVPHGFVNLHPSLLPNGQGKDPNFWCIVEEQAFGVSLHQVDEGVDTGPILAQREIATSWEDTGQTLYERALAETTEMFAESLDALLGGLVGVPQDPTAGSHHRRAELTPASRIDLDATYRARDLLNLIRARTFVGHPGAWFDDQGGRYEVRVSIQRLEDPDS